MRRQRRARQPDSANKSSDVHARGAFAVLRCAARAQAPARQRVEDRAGRQRRGGPWGCQTLQIAQTGRRAAQADAYMKAGNALHSSANVPTMPDFAPSELPAGLPPAASADLGQSAPAATPQARARRGRTPAELAPTLLPRA